ncbi:MULTISPECIES: SCP2 sterol-binding domain-containing protein [unclassified Nocardioides]|jgi:putative sterol carrier protein|uniref:SCP2 sterol-binding domain-containing protein n=1 Tax=unclassified Nocardioides TaxID=2615069 RepID=UPI00070269E4|nr:MULTISPECIES: SCP2 sterol-binding domain-containing protein [unclassified Nocardioides]KRC54137.1 sterol carrier protein [Nocardioides sp. Root79]KRC71473.1 sterol carrier protein [Nocardioides sp. Root240]
MAFKDADEVRRYIGGVFQAGFDDPEIGPKMAATGIVVKFEFTEPDAAVVIDMGKQEIGEGAGMAEPVATMRMTADLGSAYWQGKVNLPLSMARGKIKVDGNVASLLKLAPLGKKLFPKYVATLEADGRQDLVVA